MSNKVYILLSVFFLFFSCDDPTPQEFKSFKLEVNKILCEENDYNTEGEIIQTNIIERDFTSVISNLSSTDVEYTFTNEMTDEYIAYWTYSLSSGYLVDGDLTVNIHGSEGNLTANYNLNEFRWHEDLGTSSFSVSGYALPESDAENKEGVIFQKIGIENCTILTNVYYEEKDKNGLLLKSTIGYSCDATSKATLQMFY